MLYLKPQYHPLALEALQKLADDGITCTPDEILWLHQEAQRATRLTPGDAPCLDYPLVVGNAALWPLTLGADEWLTHYARPLYDGASSGIATRLQTLCIAYSMAHSRKPEMFHGLTTRRKILWRVAYWAAGLSCTLRELNAGVDRVLGLADTEPVDIPTPKEAAAAKAGTPAPRADDFAGNTPILAQLLHFYGGTPAQWLWQEPEDKILALLNQMAKILPGADTDDAKARAIAMCKFRAVVAHIRAAHQPAPDSPGGATPPAEPSASANFQTHTPTNPHTPA